MDVEFDGDFRFADTHVAIGAGRVQDTRDKELLPEVWTLVQEDLAGKQQHNTHVNNRESGFCSVVSVDTTLVDQGGDRTGVLNLWGGL